MRGKTPLTYPSSAVDSVEYSQYVSDGGVQGRSFRSCSMICNGDVAGPRTP